MYLRIVYLLSYYLYTGLSPTNFGLKLVSSFIQEGWVAKLEGWVGVAKLQRWVAKLEGWVAKFEGCVTTVS
jgi:hypothetical protein